METIAMVWGFWPLLILNAGARAITRRREENVGQRTLDRLVGTWGLFALIWAVCMLAGTPPQVYLIPDPANTILFWLVGAGLGGVIIYRSWQGRAGQG